MARTPVLPEATPVGALSADTRNYETIPGSDLRSSQGRQSFRAMRRRNRRALCRGRRTRGVAHQRRGLSHCDEVIFSSPIADSAAAHHMGRPKGNDVGVRNVRIGCFVSWLPELGAAVDRTRPLRATGAARPLWPSWVQRRPCRWAARGGEPVEERAAGARLVQR